MSDLVLVIDDTDEIRENTAELLGLAGYRVVTANNGLEGLETARKMKPDLILCDIMMPGLDGYGVLRALENLPDLNGTPFVFLTAKSERSDFRAAMDLGADDYLMKPFTGDELLRVVAARLKKSRKLREVVVNGNNPENGKEIKSFSDIATFSQDRSVKKIRNKDMIYMEGDTATNLYYVASGRVKIYKTNEWGKEYITEIVNAGGVFGHLALLGNHVHRQSAMAIEPSEVIQVPAKDFFDLLQANHSVSLHFIRLLSENMQESEEKLLQLAYNSARKRVAEALLFVYRQYCPGEEDDQCAFPVNRENLSAIAGISPESVSRNLTDFREEKLIATDNGSIRITDFRKLSKLRA